MQARRAIFAAALLALCGSVFAQTYPSKPVKVIVPFSPGSATDILGRLMADQFARSMNRPFVVENRPGAGGIPGTEAAKNAAPDGYVLTAAEGALPLKKAGTISPQARRGGNLFGLADV